MAVDHFCLKWNNFQTSILTAFESLQSTEDLADVTLTCEGLNIKAHKIILSACSPYFRTVFKENPCPHPIVILKDVLHLDLIAILNFMYHGEVLISQDQLPSFLQTAEMLQVSGLVSRSNDSDYSEVQHKRAKQKSPSKSSITPTRNDSNESPLHVKEEMAEDDENMRQSILEAALEVKESSSSILERSLTAFNKSPHPTESFDHEVIISSVPSNKSDTLEVEKKGTKHKYCELIHSPESNENLSRNAVQEAMVKNVDSELLGTKMQLDLQPHHSSQCGNCPHCGKLYSNQSSLKYHVRLVHSDLTNMYCCHLCPESFDYREDYKRHMVETHSIRN